ncbi:ADP-ribosylglycohydrolase domain protein [Actinomyces sp. ICM39]|uniref:ADP-ribosylglycohydrolase family protein n=1 Tax=Actinomyces sp. ICM39 TaxID=1105029 RepID=UPI00027708C9|nr:ADP-ribosylglycohydrolase family protein [Actinomyces sp. ICM39]EJN45165.1 ADP-ribosylglycohydrolase domain protein [Actinomyces sp. ICM39]
MDPRLPYALGALAGLARADAAHSDTLEASDGPGCEVATSAMAVALQLLRAPGEDCTTHSGTQLPTTASADARLMCAIPVGIALSTVDLEAFAETVWRVCGCTSRNEFQSAALLAAAVSIGINTRIRTRPLSYIDPLWDAVDVVSAMTPRGETDSSPDVLEVAQRTLKAVANTQSDLRSSPAPVLQETLSDCAPSSRIVPLAFFLAASPQGADEASKCFALSGSPALCEAVAETLSGIFKPTGVLPEPNLAQCSEGAQPDWLGITGQLLELHPLTPIKWIRRALGDSIPRVPRRDPSPFEASESGASTRAAADGPSTDEQRDSNVAEASSGRVIVMSELMLRYDRGSEEDPIPAGNEWTTRKGVYLSRPFTVMLAARAMGVEVISLSPIGQGPRSSVITDALAREGIVNVGPQVTGGDSGFMSPITRKFGPGETETITGMPRDAWDEFIRTLGPSDVLYIDAGIETNPPVLAAAEHALAHLPQHVRVIQDMSGAFIGPRNVRNDSVLTVLDQGSVQRLGERFMSDRTAFDASHVPAHAASFILSLFHRSTLVSTMTYESFLARPRHAMGEASEPRTRFPAPTVVSTDHDGSYSVWTGALAAALAEGNAIERSIVLANCAGALATTMPGPASCPTREQIEAAARTLPERDDVELERRTHALGALAGVVFGDAVGMFFKGMSAELVEDLRRTLPLLTDSTTALPTMPAAPAGTLTAVTHEVLASASALLSEGASPLGVEAEDRAGDELAGSRYVLRAIPVGIATVTTDAEAFAEAVWQACGNENLTRQEFQAAALVAAAISLGIDKKHYRASGIGSILGEAIDYVAALPPRGSASSEPDVLQATRKAIGTVRNFRDDIYERVRGSIGTSADPTQSVPAAFALILKDESQSTAVSAAVLGGETSVIAAISSAVLGAIRGVTMFSPNNLATIERVSHPGVAPLSERLVERRVYVSEETSEPASTRRNSPDDAASN